MKPVVNVFTSPSAGLIQGAPRVHPHNAVVVNTAAFGPDRQPRNVFSTALSKVQKARGFHCRAFKPGSLEGAHLACSTAGPTRVYLRGHDTSLFARQIFVRKSAGFGFKESSLECPVPQLRPQLGRHIPFWPCLLLPNLLALTARQVKMPDELGVPVDGEGLAWIVSQEFVQLNLLPGIRPDTILAASLGNQQAVAVLRAKAQQHATANSATDRTFDPWHALHGCNCRRCEADPESRARREHTSLLWIEAARQGRLAAMHWLRVLCEPSLDSSETTSLELAVAHGNLDIVKFLLSGPRPPYWDHQLLIAATAHPECLAWLLQRECLRDRWDCVTHEALRCLARNGCLDTMSYIHDHVCSIPGNRIAWLATVAAGRGHLSMVQWLLSLLSSDQAWPSGLSTAAASSGNLTLLQWLRSRDPPYRWQTASITAAAVQGGNLATLQWLRAQDPLCELSPMCTTYAAMAGRMDLLKWLRAQQPPCPWYFDDDEDNLSCAWIAADRQDLAMLQWLHAQKCPWNAQCTLRAAENGNIPMLQWLLAQDPPCPLSPDCMAGAASWGNLPMMQYLRCLGQSLNASLYYLAAEADAPDALRWLLQQGLPAPARYLVSGDYGYWCGGLKIKPRMLMLLGEIGAPLPCFLDNKATWYPRDLQRARRAYCTFHGLLRWSRRAVADPNLDTNRAFNRPSTSMAGQHLLIRLSMLPQELISKIATMAELQHGVELP